MCFGGFRRSWSVGAADFNRRAPLVMPGGSSDIQICNPFLFQGLSYLRQPISIEAEIYEILFQVKGQGDLTMLAQRLPGLKHDPALMICKEFIPCHNNPVLCILWINIIEALFSIDLL